MGILPQYILPGAPVQHCTDPATGQDPFAAFPDSSADLFTERHLIKLVQNGLVKSLAESTANRWHFTVHWKSISADRRLWCFHTTCTNSGQSGSSD